MRAYLRLDPHLADRKAAYPDGALRAYVETLCWAEQQPLRGRFRNERLLRVLLEKRGRWVPYLIEHGDLSVEDAGVLYVEGWDEWQEGDFRVADRMVRIHARRGDTYTRTPGALRQAQYRERTKVFERDNYTCRYCGNGSYPREYLILEHVDPKGPSTDDNLVTACRPCNKLKGGRTPEEAGMPLRNVTVTGDGNDRPSHTSSGSGKRLANSGGGRNDGLPSGNAMGFRPRASVDDVARQEEESWLKCADCDEIGRKHPASGDHPFRPELRSVS